MPDDKPPIKPDIKAKIFEFFDGPDVVINGKPMSRRRLAGVAVVVFVVILMMFSSGGDNAPEPEPIIAPSSTHDIEQPLLVRLANGPAISFGVATPPELVEWLTAATREFVTTPEGKHITPSIITYTPEEATSKVLLGAYSLAAVIFPHDYQIADLNQRWQTKNVKPVVTDTFLLGTTPYITLFSSEKGLIEAKAAWNRTEGLLPVEDAANAIPYSILTSYTLFAAAGSAAEASGPWLSICGIADSQGVLNPDGPLLSAISVIAETRGRACNALTTYDIDPAIVMGAFTKYKKAVKRTRIDPSTLVKDMAYLGPEACNVALMPENAYLLQMKEFRALNATPPHITGMTPRKGLPTVVARFTFAPLDAYWIKQRTRLGVRAFLSFLQGEKAQTLAALHGIRPVETTATQAFWESHSDAVTYEEMESCSLSDDDFVEGLMELWR